MSNKDLVARARAMLTADDVDTKDMLAMVGELADAIQRVPCILANRCEALDAKPAAVKESLTTGATDSVPEGYALVEVGILSDRCLAVAMRDAAIVSKATNGDSTAVATATIHAYLLAASGRWGGK